MVCTTRTGRLGLWHTGRGQDIRPSFTIWELVSTNLLMFYFAKM